MKQATKRHPAQATRTGTKRARTRRLRLWSAELRKRTRSDPPERSPCLADPRTGERSAFGVLCDLHAARTGEGRWSGDRYFPKGDFMDGCSYALDVRVAVWAGVPDYLEWDVHVMDHQTGMPFGRIADRIDEECERLEAA